MVDNISELQPHLVVYLPNDIEPEEAHILCFAQIRMLANGETFEGDCDRLIQILCKALTQLMDYQL